MKVLIIQQNSRKNGVISSLFAENGEVIHKRSLKDAMDTFVDNFCNNKPFDLVVSDSHTAVKRLRRVEKKLTTDPIKYSKMMVLGPGNNYKRVLDAFEGGANTYLEYPHTPSEFIQGLNDINLSV